MDMYEALAALLKADEERQREDRGPRSRAEKLAHRVICDLSAVMRGAYPELKTRPNFMVQSMKRLENSKTVIVVDCGGGSEFYCDRVDLADREEVEPGLFRVYDHADEAIPESGPVYYGMTVEQVHEALRWLDSK